MTPKLIVDFFPWADLVIGEVWEYVEIVPEHALPRIPPSLRQDGTSGQLQGAEHGLVRASTIPYSWMVDV